MHYDTPPLHNIPIRIYIFFTLILRINLSIHQPTSNSDSTDVRSMVQAKYKLGHHSMYSHIARLPTFASNLHPQRNGFSFQVPQRISSKKLTPSPLNSQRRSLRIRSRKSSCPFTVVASLEFSKAAPARSRT